MTGGPPYHLLRHHNHRFRGESSIAVVEEIFQTGTKEVDHQDVVQAFLTEIVDVGYAGCTQSAMPLKINRHSSRQPTRILYVRYSSRNCGASLFLGSCLKVSVALQDGARILPYKFDCNLLVVQ